MSRHAQLPPRCPFQTKSVNQQIHNLASSTLSKDTKLYPQHQRSVSQSSILEEQSAWLDNLLSDLDSNAKGIFHRRSASDSSTILDGFVPLQNQTPDDDKSSASSEKAGDGFDSAYIYGPNSPRSKGVTTLHENALVSKLSEEAFQNPKIFPLESNAKGIFHRHSAASDSLTNLDGFVHLPSQTPLNDNKSSDSCEPGDSLESACVYGPNSPRAKSVTTLPESALVSALSEYELQKPMGFCISEIPVLVSAQDAHGSAHEVNPAVKRHSGQRSRVRKLQYIAELESTVHVFQILESELTVKVASLIQQRVALSVENSELKQQVVKMQQEILIRDAQYQSLRKEIERLKMVLSPPYQPKSKPRTNIRYSGTRGAESAAPASSGISWQMLDLGKLNLNSTKS